MMRAWRPTWKEPAGAFGKGIGHLGQIEAGSLCRFHRFRGGGDLDGAQKIHNQVVGGSCADRAEMDDLLRERCQDCF